MKNLSKFIGIALLAMTIFSCSDDETGTVQPSTIADIASANANLTVLVQALDRAGLVATLDGTGTFTVFAPTNTAFNTFLTANGFVTNGVPDVNSVPVPALKEILLNHVIATEQTSAVLPADGYIKTLGKGAASTSNTLSMYVKKTGTAVRLNGVSSVTAADVDASNGVIHIVDAVIGLPTIVTHAVANANFDTLESLLIAQSLTETLGGTVSSPFTVFAPLNSAFDTATLDLYTGLDSAKKTAVLKYHVITGANVLANAIPVSSPTFESGILNFSGTVITDEKARLTNIVLTDVQCANGVIHAVDKVLLPNSVP